MTDPTKRLTKSLSDAIPLGEHPTPFNEWISVRLDIVQETIDHLEDLDKGNKTWLDAFKQSQKDISMYEAQSEIAITFLQRLLNPSTSDENLQANIDGQIWLRSLGR